MVVRIGIDLSQICLFFFFFSFYSPTHGRRTSAGLNKSSSRSSIHLQPSDFPARRNDQTNLCDRDTSVEKVGRLKSKFKAILSPRLARHPLLPPLPLLVPRLFRFILELMKHGGRDVCWCARSWNEPLFSDNLKPRFFPTKSRVKATLPAETQIFESLSRDGLFITGGLWIVLRIIRACHC